MEMIVNFLASLPYTEYCERQGSAAWNAEPVNAVTAIVLLISAFYIWKLIKNRHGVNDKRFIFLPFLLAVSALANIFYHLSPNSFAYWLDVVPLAIFWLNILYLLFLFASSPQKIKG